MAGFIGFSSGFAVSWAKAGAAIRHVIAAAAKIVFNILNPRGSPPGVSRRAINPSLSGMNLE